MKGFDIATVAVWNDKLLLVDSVFSNLSCYGPHVFIRHSFRCCACSRMWKLGRSPADVRKLILNALFHEDMIVLYGNLNKQGTNLVRIPECFVCKEIRVNRQYEPIDMSLVHELFMPWDLQYSNSCNLTYPLLAYCFHC
ncbi:hypothetical protein Nepgr_002940 [Nepenthes gracilis]|uniref:Uncharacterized protein n=1 Tax=Nepenthes gracilis TaxID=150966 RepID=A0AAD3RYI6_NEPGR|nr:hypothetical protein Nepgr_002940 [Nepenthes gracilis]